MKCLVLFLTNACNFRCRTCLRDYGRADHLPFEVLERALPEVRGLGYGAVSFTGGEPCLHPRFEDMARIIVGSGMNVCFVSNGSMLDGYRFLVEKYKRRIGFACFSLDGATPEVHDSVRQKGSFEKVLESIRYFVSNGVYTKTAVCVNRLNLHQVEDIARLSESLGVKNVNFMAAIRTGRNGDVVLSKAEKAELSRRIGGFRRKYKVGFFTATSVQAAEELDFCNGLNLSDLTVNPRGEVVFCCDTTGDGAVVGSLREASFTELYCRALDMSAGLKKAVARKVAEGGRIGDYNNCEFCDGFLKSYARGR